jgi:hypothetical protein
MSSKKSHKKGTGASSSSEQQTNYEGCKCEGCYKHGPLSGAAHHAPFDARFAATRRGLEKVGETNSPVGSFLKCRHAL